MLRQPPAPNELSPPHHHQTEPEITHGRSEQTLGLFGQFLGPDIFENHKVVTLERERIGRRKAGGERFDLETFFAESLCQG